MTKLLEKAFAWASKLPATEQNQVAKWLLDELIAEERWSQAFAGSQDVLGRLAREAIEEHRQGKTRPLDLESC